MPSPRTPDARMGDFPLKRYAVVLLAIVALFVLLGMHVYSLNGTLRSFDASIHSLATTAGRLEHLDEALTMSARMAAATGDPFWQDRYHELEAALQELLDESLETQQPPILLDFLAEVDDVNDKLVDLEDRALELVAGGNSEEAVALLNGPRYSELKTSYTLSVQKLLRGIDQQSRRIMSQAAFRARVLLGTLAVAVPGIFVMALFLLRIVRRYVADRQRAESALREAGRELEDRVARATRDLSSSNARLEAILHSMTSGVIVYDPVDGGNDFVIRDCNPAVELIEGTDKDAIVGQRITRVFPGVREMGLLDVLRRVHRTGESESLPVRTYQDDEREGWRENAVSRLPDGAVLAVYQDVTERKQAEAELRHSEQRFRTLFNSVYEAVFVHDPEGRILDVNDPMLELFGVTREGALAGSVEHDFSSPRNPVDTLPDIWRRVNDGEEMLFDWIARRPATGEEFPVEVFLRRVDLGEESFILANVRDMTAHREAERRIAKSERRFHDVALTSGDWIWEVDAEARYTFASGRVEELMGYTPEEMLSLTPFDLMPPDEAKRIRPLFDDLAARGEPIVDLENRFVAKDGTEGVFLTNGVPTRDREGNLTGYFGVDKDITRRKEDEQQLKLFEEVFNNAMEGITITDAAGTIVEVNPAFTEITGYSADEALGNNPNILKSDRHEAEFYERMWKALLRHGHWSGEIWNRRKDGDAYPEWLSISAIRNEAGDPTHYVAVFHDITEMKRKEQQIAYQAYHDPLTDLPNRVLFMDRLHMALAHIARKGTSLGVLFIDLDNFKHVNDSLGHSVGDRLLQKVGSSLLNMLRDEDTVARLGGDEFVILIQDIEDHHPAVRLAERIIHTFGRPFKLDGNELFVTPSIGITMAPQDGTQPEVLIKNADMAMYRAKDDGKNAYRLFAQEMNASVKRRLELESALRRGLVRDEFTVHFQPKIDIATGAIAGMEALVRWMRSDGEVVGPAEFIPLAEETGIILPLGEKVLIEACGRTSELLRMGLPPMRVSVNLSLRQFAERDLATMVREALDYAALSPASLELEITETILAKDIDSAVVKLEELSSMGIQLAIDDFGTGYSSLYYLKRLPLHTLKIDQSFVRDIPSDPGDAAIVKTMLHMAADLNLDVVAEGVENEQQLAFLTENGCRYAQGYLYARPMPFDAFVEFARAHAPEA